MNSDIAIFILNLKIEEFHLNSSVNIKNICDFKNLMIKMPVFKIINKKIILKNFHNELLSYYLAHLIVQLPKTTLTLSQLKSPLSFVIYLLIKFIEIIIFFNLD